MCLLKVNKMKNGQSVSESFSGEGEEHQVENFTLCSFAHFACSPILQAFLNEEEMCKVALACHFSLDALFLSRD